MEEDFEFTDEQVTTQEINHQETHKSVLTQKKLWVVDKSNSILMHTKQKFIKQEN